LAFKMPIHLQGTIAERIPNGNLGMLQSIGKG